MTHLRTHVFAIACIAAAQLIATPASALVYDGASTGLQEIPPNASPATGFATVTILGDSLTVDVDWAGLVGGNPAAAHIHCCTPLGANVGVAVGFPGFPAATSGTYLHTFDLLDAAIYTANFLSVFGGGTAAGAEAALIAGLDAGQAYVNIHNATFPGGEIRANLLAVVPEPFSIALFGLGLAAIGLARRRRI